MKYNWSSLSKDDEEFIVKTLLSQIRAAQNTLMMLKDTVAKKELLPQLNEIKNEAGEKIELDKFEEVLGNTAIEVSEQSAAIMEKLMSKGNTDKTDDYSV